MKNNAMISEKFPPVIEVLQITSAAGATSLNRDMRGAGQAIIAACIQGNFSTVAIDLMESSAASVAGSSAAGGKAGMVLGGASTLIPVTGGVQKMTLTMSSATSNEYFNFSADGKTKKFINTTSTALLNSSAWVSTALYFGSTVGSTVATGIQFSIDSLKTAMVNSLAFGPNVLSFSTGTTATLTIQAQGEIGNLGISATAVMSAEVNQAVGAFNIAAEQLASTANKRFIAVKVSTASTSCNVGVTVIRTGGHYLPPKFSGKLST